MVEENHVRMIPLAEVTPDAEEEEMDHTISFNARGQLRLQRRRAARRPPTSTEELRLRLRTWGLAFTFARARHPGQAWLADAVPSVIQSYTDYLLGEDGAAMSQGGVRPTFSLVLAYDAAVRRRQARQINEGLPFGAALREAWRHTETRERHFITPLLFPAIPAGTRRGGGGTTGDDAAVRADARREEDAAGGAAATQPRKKAKKTKLKARTPEGTEVCFAWNRAGCQGPCSRAHVCGVCFGLHMAHECDADR